MTNKNRILIVEDDASLRKWIEDYLHMNHFVTESIGDGAEAVGHVKKFSPDLILLDLMLPNKNGLDLCSEIRGFCQVPILVMTASDEESDEVISLEVGANDFVFKPIKPRVLLARVKSLLRYSNGRAIVGTEQTIITNRVSLDPSARAFLVDGENIDLSSREFDLLLLLASTPGETVSREKMMKNLRGFAYDGTNRSIDIAVSRLRKKVEDSCGDAVEIKTVWGKGYLLVIYDKNPP